MSYGSGLSTQEILGIFSEETLARSGKVLDVFDDGARLFARSVLPRVREVRPDDPLQGGVAMRGMESQVWVHPYLFRKVCTNGAIMAQAVQTRHVTGIDELDGDDASSQVREAVEACCSDDAFTSAVHQVRSATEIQADLALAMLPHLAHLPAAHRDSLMMMIFERFAAAGDTTRFGLMNAVTSVGRDTRDPELRWRLEELGGGIPAMLLPARDDSGSHAERELELTV